MCPYTPFVAGFFSFVAFGRSMANNVFFFVSCIVTQRIPQSQHNMIQIRCLLMAFISWKKFLSFRIHLRSETSNDRWSDHHNQNRLKCYIFAKFVKGISSEWKCETNSPYWFIPEECVTCDDRSHGNVCTVHLTGIEEFRCRRRLDANRIVHFLKQKVRQRHRIRNPNGRAHVIVRFGRESRNSSTNGIPERGREINVTIKPQSHIRIRARTSQSQSQFASTRRGTRIVN